MREFLTLALGLLWDQPEAVAVVIIVVVVVKIILDKTNVKGILFLGFHSRN